jgi:chaperonin cofactor prefoldin
MLLVKVGLLLLTWAAIIQGGEWQREDRERLKSLQKQIYEMEYGKQKKILKETEEELQTQSRENGLTDQQLQNSIRLSKEVLYNLEKLGVDTTFDYSQIMYVSEMNELQNELQKEVDDLKIKYGEMSENAVNTETKVNAGKEGEMEGNDEKERRKCNKYDKLIAAGIGCFSSMVHMYWFQIYIA